MRPFTCGQNGKGGVNLSIPRSYNKR